MSAYFDVPVAEGDYNIYSNLTVPCSCFGSGLGAGGEQNVIRVKPYTARMIYVPVLSSPEPHNANSDDRYENSQCSGFCQPGSVGYKHGEGMGHQYLEIRGFDTTNDRAKTRYCKGYAEPKSTQPECKPT